jgi:hypothetical protein
MSSHWDTRIRPRLRTYDDTDVLAAIAHALGMSWAETASLLNVGESTLYNRSAKNAPFYDKVRAFTEARIAERDARAAARTANKSSDLIASAQDRIKGLFDKAFLVSERAVHKALEDGDDITYEKALEVHKSFTTWAAKFAASEAPKRLQMEGQVNHNHRLVADSTIQRLNAFMDKHQALLPEAVDAEVVS